MRTWLLRGGVLAVLHAAAQVLVSAYTVRHPTGSTWLTSLVLGVLVAIAGGWAAVDTWLDVPERGRVWLTAAFVAGWLAGVLAVLGKALWVDNTGTSELGGALTGGAAFTALVVLVPAGIGLLVGRFVGQRSGHSPAGSEQDTARTG